MSRLFVTPREIDYIADITKELTKDVIGQKIYYYRVREDLTNIHDIYEEAQDKVFDPPIELDAFVSWQPEEIHTNRFGGDEYSTIEIYLHSRDLLDKDVVVNEGDFFSYGIIFFEITSMIVVSNIYGQVEHTTGIKLIGKQARQGLIDMSSLGPTSENSSSENAIQNEFTQQRGFNENSEGITGDVRQLQKNEKLTEPISGPHGVSDIDDSATIDSSFYGND